jgi:hypothetical protein
MRLLGCLFAAVCVSLLQSPCVNAQTSDQHSSDVKSEPAEPVHQHRDKHHGHDHIYPDRGAIFHELPKGAVAVHHAGLSYKFSEGIWFESRGQAFVVVTPAIGAVVTELPGFVTQVDNGSETYLYANDIFYQARPDLGGYEVVNDPDEVIPPASVAAAPPAAAAAAAIPLAAAPSVNSAVPASTAGANLPAVVAGTAIAAPAVAAAVSAPSAVPAAAVVAAPAAATAPAPAAASSTLSSATSHGTKVVAVPKNGQSPDLQARDHYECYKFAVTNSGFDPMHANGATAAAQAAGKQSDYERAQAACFEGRGYSIQ